MERAQDIEDQALDRLFDEIESERFAGTANLASSYRMFMRIVANSQEAASLIRMLDSPTRRARLLSRIHRLANSQVDERFANAWDVAIATYVLAMTRKHALFGELAAIGARPARRTWWLAHTLAHTPKMPSCYAVASGASEGIRPRIERVLHARDKLAVLDPFGQAAIESLLEPPLRFRAPTAGDLPHAPSWHYWARPLKNSDDRQVDLVMP